MKTQKISGPAMFMYAAIAVMLLTAAVCLSLYYSGATDSRAVMWTGAVAFMIVYHFWLRIIMGNVTRRIGVDRERWWFKEHSFEKKLYRLLRVKKWKGYALTYEPQLFSVRDRSLDEIVYAMTKAELDHWINQIISLLGLFFFLLWGKFWLFFAVTVFAMLFDGHFIVIQRYNRPRVLRLMRKRSAEGAEI